MTEDATLLVDLNALFWRFWGRSKHSQFDTYLSTVNRIEAMSQDYKVTIVCADSLRNWRHERAPEYKSNRPKKPDTFTSTLLDTIAHLRESFPVVDCDNFEADDVIASLVAQSFDPVFILSDDKDLYQLIDDSVTLITTAGHMTPEECKRKFAVEPSKIRDLIALMGDDSDNVKGCPGVGPKMAAALLNAFGDIGGIKEANPVELQKLRGVGPSAVKSITEWDPALAVELVSLRTDCPVSLEELLRKAAA